ncbi:hypothetical protein CNBG_3761 [Cryptococcus deuterogattii R265]|uniref:Protein-lysine N-methyltransferase EFM4 n=1 Tax=Cryptococcus deuterogattii (strain R265) TaxID=294750 RepID=A0A095CFI9_CRYD2|nr:hypothetical protein CNBG_3761 [Cryptococcus deuterogattii R265]KIR69692.1 hypothetical protein I310_06544 [Cryptococcus deuterogattii CA1014]
MTVDELPPSRLGTKEHWDDVYEREVNVFNDIGDEGEIWFGEDSVRKMREWAHTHLLPSISPDHPLRILECGSGNGTLLLSFLTSPSPPPQYYHLTGIDYCEPAKILAEGVEAAKRESLEDEMDPEDVENQCTTEWRVADLLRHDFEAENWDLVMDKGTYDALCLSDEPVEEDEQKRLPSGVYPERVAKLVKPGGFFLITSCNFTEEEIKERYSKEGLNLTFHSSVPHPTFSFGGKKGSTVCTVAFQKAPL